ncbi:4'-phosphopantetheinyl transferase family protein [Streptomyces exfoliatus]|uniref:4'-phosphopantetheinyl transferase family protein n=1 Tax=Streptomyces exfoliatus TaxID=1905 RepID=UPI003C2ACE9F
MTGVPRPGLRVLVRYGRAAGEPDPRDLAVLSPQERRQAGRFRQPHRGAAYAAAHATARRCLAERTGGTPEGLHFGRLACPGCGDPDHGRPVVEHPATTWESSLSRSGAHWLFVAADGAPVGVDIERIRPVDLGVLGRTVLSGAEAAYLAGLAPEPRQGAFMRCWTRKEAVVKATGIGIEADLRSVEVRPWQDTAVVAHQAVGCAVTHWTVRDLSVPPDCRAALAVPADREPHLDLASRGGTVLLLDPALRDRAPLDAPPHPALTRT